MGKVERRTVLYYVWVDEYSVIPDGTPIVDGTVDEDAIFDDGFPEDVRTAYLNAQDVTWKRTSDFLRAVPGYVGHEYEQTTDTEIVDDTDASYRAAMA